MRRHCDPDPAPAPTSGAGNLIRSVWKDEPDSLLIGIDPWVLASVTPCQMCGCKLLWAEAGHVPDDRETWESRQ